MASRPRRNRFTLRTVAPPMHPKIVPARCDTCGKVRYATKEAADIVVHRIQVMGVTRGRNPDHGLPVYTYQCSAGWWHMTTWSHLDLQKARDVRS